MADPVAWTFAQGGEYTEQYDWLTDVLQAPTGGTQHRRIRQSPRVTLGFAALESGANRRWMDQRLRANSAGAWWVPLCVDECRLATAASAADTVLDVDTGPARFTVGGRVLLIGDNPRRFDVRVIDAVAADSLTLATGLTYAWPAHTRVLPLRRGRLAAFPSIGRFTADDSALVDLRFRLEETLEDAPVVPGSTYRDFPVFDFIAPVWTSDPTWVPERLTATVDYGVAVPVVADTAGVALGLTTFQYAPDTAADVAAFRGALCALAGRWAPAWVPSWAHDLRVVANVSAGATTLDVEGPLLSTQPLAANHRDIRVELYDGTVYYRRITAVSAPSAGVDRLTLDSALPAAFTVARVRMACFISLSVQESDTNLLRHFGPDCAQCELSWRELAHDV